MHVSYALQLLCSKQATVVIADYAVGLPAERRSTCCNLCCADGQQIQGRGVLLAVGHSARNMYRHLAEHGIAMTPKPFAMVRLPCGTLLCIDSKQVS
jgi:uncharacterized FAD-dependent dehydrogenase